jgi:predicted signal transduction protein with EAL and GGDEF domain
MRELGDQLLRRACLDAMRWPSDVTLTFNALPHELRDRTGALRVFSILTETKLSAQRLEIEISDRALTGDVDCVRLICRELRHKGVRLALGGFGTGSATVSQLLQLRFDRIKIARSIVQRIGEDRDASAIVRGMAGGGQPRT